jgi:ketosteroid isomerase-like protein
MANRNAELIESLYAAFDRHDGDTMAAAYAPNAKFSDPVFTDLTQNEPGAMWRMLTERSEDLRVELVEHEARDDDTGSAHWLADYTFGQTGRKVHNDVRATFRFQDGRIVQHRDDFDFYSWAKQALGPMGLLLGWTPIVRNGVRKKARAGLDEFLARD